MFLAGRAFAHPAKNLKRSKDFDRYSVLLGLLPAASPTTEQSQSSHTQQSQSSRTQQAQRSRLGNRADGYIGELDLVRNTAIAVFNQAKPVESFRVRQDKTGRGQVH
jgi:hypothetical protein